MIMMIVRIRIIDDDDVDEYNDDDDDDDGMTMINISAAIFMIGINNIHFTIKDLIWNNIQNQEF